MKKHLLSVLGLIAAGTMSATQYMHVNSADGNEYDIKIEKTDRVSHVEKDGEQFIKVTRTDNSYSLYPLEGAEVTFDEEIARMNDNVSNWGVVSTITDGCELDTTALHEKRLAGASGNELENERHNALQLFSDCCYQVKKAKFSTFSTQEVEVQRGANRYAEKVFGNIATNKEYKDKNIVFSPTSLQFALAMVANGADNDAAFAQLTNALGKENIPLDDLNQMYSKRMNNLQLTNPNKLKIGVANAVFLQNDIPFGKNFLQNLNSYYKAVANNVDFQQDSTYKLMDEWAAASTDSMIPTMGLQKGPYVLVLANALSFQGGWLEKFYTSNTKLGSFTNSKGEQSEVYKMRNTFESCYSEGNNYQLATLDFSDGYRMNIILPKEGVSPLDALAEIDLDSIVYKVHADTAYHVNLLLPKFKIDGKIPLNEALKETGLENLFGTYFNLIAPTANVKDVAQLTHLEIDEEGAKAAAITTMTVGVESFVKNIKVIEMDVNRPFVVTINNPKSHEVLFVGLINDPSESK